MHNIAGLLMHNIYGLHMHTITGLHMQKIAGPHKCTIFLQPKGHNMHCTQCAAQTPVQEACLVILLRVPQSPTVSPETTLLLLYNLTHSLYSLD